MQDEVQVESHTHGCAALQHPLETEIDVVELERLRRNADECFSFEPALGIQWQCNLPAGHTTADAYGNILHMNYVVQIRWTEPTND